MHYRRYIIRDGVPVMPDIANNATIVYTLLGETQINMTKNTYDILDFGYIIEYYGELPPLNQFQVKTFVRAREKSTNKIYAGESSGMRISSGQRTVWPNIAEV